MAVIRKKRDSLIAFHIRDVSVGVIESHLEAFREAIGGGRAGIYVLRKGRDDVFYVGLARSLRSRIARHLKDHLKGEWDRFDLYGLRRTKLKYLKELEALCIRVSKPRRNRAEPNFPGSVNATRRLRRALERETAALFPDLDKAG